MSQTGTSKIKLPEPSAEAKAHSQRLAKFIHQEIARSGGQIRFCDFMQLALYSPGLGYYSAGMQKFGKSGDFVTAPEISPLFAQVIAIQSEILLKHLPSGDLMEVGAGSGRLAGDILKELARRDCLPKHYYILEVSADLRERQQRFLQQYVPEYYSRISWLEQLPEQKFSGLVIANELLDAMPVHLVKLEQGKIYERYVGLKDQQLIWQDQETDNPQLFEYNNKIKTILSAKQHLSDGPTEYVTEINLLAKSWISSLAEKINHGAMLLIDYGYPELEYFHPQRHMGTLMCHYQHHRHEDPFYLPGLQDITAHVNFSDIAEAAVNANLTIKGYTTQAHFLLAGGLEELAQRVDLSDVSAYTQMAQQIKMLTLPDEMGELFKVIYLTKGDMPQLPAFKMWDMRERL